MTRCEFKASILERLSEIPPFHIKFSIEQLKELEKIDMIVELIEKIKKEVDEE